MRRATSLWRREEGASLAEFALITPILLLLTFGILDIGFLMWQFQQGTIASKRAVRIAATRELVTPGAFNDCGPSRAATAVAGTICSSLAFSGSGVWATCKGDGSGDAGCGADVTRVAQEVAKFYPRVTPADITITLSDGGLGFQGLGHPVPIVTVQFENVDYDYLFIGGLAQLTSFEMPSMTASAAAEDMRNGG